MDEAQRAAFGASVVRWRSQRGMSQGELARAAGIAENTMGRIETGQRTQRSKTAAVMEYTGVEVPEDLPADVEMAMDMLGSWLATLPKDSRRSVIRDLGTWIGSHRTTARDEAKAFAAEDPEFAARIDAERRRHGLDPENLRGDEVLRDVTEDTPGGVRKRRNS